MIPVRSAIAGRQGRKTAAFVLMAALFLALTVLAGCGEDEKSDDSASRQDGSTVAAGTDDIKNVEGAGGLNLAGDDEVITGYTWSDCVVEMTNRYGSESTAEDVCETLYTDHSDAQVAQLDTVLTEVEKKLGVTPGSTGGTGGTGGTDGGTGGTDGGTGGTDGGTGGTGGGPTDPSGGWSTEIIVPPQP